MSDEADKRIRLGAEFFDVTSDDFATLNKAANQQGLMAFIFAMEGDTEDEKRICFELVQADK